MENSRLAVVVQFESYFHLSGHSACTPFGNSILSGSKLRLNLLS